MKFSTFLIVSVSVFVIFMIYRGATLESGVVPGFGSSDPKIIQLKKDIEHTMQSFLSALNSITDTASARKALPTIQQTHIDLDRYLTKMRGLSDDDKLLIKRYMMDFVKYLKKTSAQTQSHAANSPNHRSGYSQDRFCPDLLQTYLRKLSNFSHPASNLADGFSALQSLRNAYI